MVQPELKWGGKITSWCVNAALPRTMEKIVPEKTLVLKMTNDFSLVPVSIGICKQRILTIVLLNWDSSGSSPLEHPGNTL
jgi:hypothetical protein